MSWQNPRFWFKMCFGRCFGLNRVVSMWVCVWLNWLETYRKMCVQIRNPLDPKIHSKWGYVV